MKLRCVDTHASGREQLTILLDEEETRSLDPAFGKDSSYSREQLAEGHRRFRLITSPGKLDKRPGDSVQDGKYKRGI